MYIYYTKQEGKDALNRSDELYNLMVLKNWMKLFSVFSF